MFTDSLSRDALAAMYEAKTKPTDVSVQDYLDAIEDDARRQDCQALAKLMRRVTGWKPKMWGPSIVGYGQYHYRYTSGHEGDCCVVGFSSRKAEISLYVDLVEPEVDALLSRLGKHKRSKGCLYVKRLSDIDLKVLEELVAKTVEIVRRRYPAGPKVRKSRK